MRQILSLLLFAAMLPAWAQTWETLATQPVALTYPVVVVVNGNIHVMGGGGPAGATTLHLRYKPSGNTWDTMAPVPYAAQQPAGAVVNGKIHFFGGGYPNTGTRLAWHYAYDPDSNSWKQRANVPTAVAIHKSVSMDGKLYSLSGQPDKTAFNVYDPMTDQWSSKNPLPDQNFWYGAIVEVNNELYRFGGGAYFAPATEVHKYNKVTDSWTDMPSLPEGNHGLAAAAIGDSVMITGGYVNGKEERKSLVYHTVSKTYQEVTWLPVARDYHNMVSIGNCIYVVGGNNNSNTAVGKTLLRICSDKISGLANVKWEEKSLNIIYNRGLISIEGEALADHQHAVVTLFDISGKLISSENSEIVNGMINANAASVQPGYYLLRVETGNDSFTRKLMITGY